jgi:hypothetical protein
MGQHWVPGEAAPMHFHDKDTVAVYLEDGDVKSTSLDGTVTVNPHTAGTASFNRGNRTHTKVLASGKQRAIITELKQKKLEPRRKSSSLKMLRPSASRQTISPSMTAFSTLSLARLSRRV